MEMDTRWLLLVALGVQSSLRRTNGGLGRSTALEDEGTRQMQILHLAGPTWSLTPQDQDTCPVRLQQGGLVSDPATPRAGAYGFLCALVASLKEKSAQVLAKGL